MRGTCASGSTPSASQGAGIGPALAAVADLWMTSPARRGCAAIVIRCTERRSCTPRCWLRPRRSEASSPPSKRGGSAVTRSTTSSGCAGGAIWWPSVEASTRCVLRTTAPTQLQQHGMRVAALGLALTAPATLSHESAAAELGLELLDPDLSSLHVTRPIRGQLSVARQGSIHHAADLPEHHVVRRDGLLDLTTIARTAIDVGRATDRFECAVAALGLGPPDGRSGRGAPGGVHPLPILARGSDAQRRPADRGRSR